MKATQASSFHRKTNILGSFNLICINDCNTVPTTSNTGVWNETLLPLAWDSWCGQSSGIFIVCLRSYQLTSAATQTRTKSPCGYQDVCALLHQCKPIPRLWQIIMFSQCWNIQTSYPHIWLFKPGIFGIKEMINMVTWCHLLLIWSPRLLQQWRIVASRVVAILWHGNTLEH